MCSDCEAYGLKKHGLTRSECTLQGLLVHLQPDRVMTWLVVCGVWGVCGCGVSVCVCVGGSIVSVGTTLLVHQTSYLREISPSVN